MAAVFQTFSLPHLQSLKLEIQGRFDASQVTAFFRCHPNLLHLIVSFNDVKVDLLNIMSFDGELTTLGNLPKLCTQ